MFEKIWKPTFDTWTNGMNDLLEKYFRSPSTLQGITSTLNTTFRGKKLKDKTVSMVLSTVGLSSAVDQKKLLHLMTKFGAQLEDLDEKVETLSQTHTPTMEEFTQAQSASLSQLVETLTAAQSVAQAQSIEKDRLLERMELRHTSMVEQLAALHHKFDELLAGQSQERTEVSAHPSIETEVETESIEEKTVSAPPKRARKATKKKSK